MTQMEKGKFRVDGQLHSYWDEFPSCTERLLPENYECILTTPIRKMQLPYGQRNSNTFSYRGILTTTEISYLISNSTIKRIRGK